MVDAEMSANVDMTDEQELAEAALEADEQSQRSQMSAHVSPSVTQANDAPPKRHSVLNLQSGIYAEDDSDDEKENIPQRKSRRSNRASL
jgi:hypothetical protein